MSSGFYYQNPANYVFKDAVSKTNREHP